VEEVYFSAARGVPGAPTLKGVGLLAFVSFSEAPNLNDNGLAGFASSLFTVQ